MAYNKLTFKDLKKRGVSYKIVDLGLAGAAPVTPSQHLLDDLEQAPLFPILSEKAKSELIITPILKEIHKNNPNRFTIFSGYTLDVEEELTGICDYIIANVPSALEIEAPIFCLVESKNKAPDEGFAQCAAEMYAAYLYNQQEKKPIEIIYGCATNGFDWIFMRLENKVVYVDSKRYKWDNIALLLGILQHIINQYK